MADGEKLKMLVEMGFNEEISRNALLMNNNNLEVSMEWVLVHGNEQSTSTSSSNSASNVSSNVLNLNTAEVKTIEEAKESQETTENIKNDVEKEPEEVVAQANSLKCDECGKLLKDEAAATYHAAKTNHSNFSECVESIKPKTKEEIEEQKRLMAEKLVRLRQERQEKEREEEIEREKKRRVQGRQITEIRQKVQEDEMKRIAEEKRREKIALEQNKLRIKEQIAKDREQFRKKQEQEAANTPAVVPQTTPQATSQPQEKRTYDECKIQVRLTDGKTIVNTFKPKEQLANVRLWIQLNRTDDPSNGDFNLVQPFPRKTYTEDEMMQSLESLSLVPASNLLIVSRR